MKYVSTFLILFGLYGCGRIECNGEVTTCVGITGDVGGSAAPSDKKGEEQAKPSTGAVGAVVITPTSPAPRQLVRSVACDANTDSSYIPYNYRRVRYWVSEYSDNTLEVRAFIHHPHQSEKEAVISSASSRYATGLITLDAFLTGNSKWEISMVRGGLQDRVLHVNYYEGSNLRYSHDWDPQVCIVQ